MNVLIEQECDAEVRLFASVGTISSVTRSVLIKPGCDAEVCPVCRLSAQYL